MGGYDRKQTIDNMARTIWAINMLPMLIFLFFFTSFGIVLAFPLSLIAWVFIGDRPIHRMQPMNFFYLMFWGMGESELGSETRFMRTVYRFFADLNVISDYHYKGLYDFFYRGKEHPVLGFKYPLPARLLGLAFYGLSTYPFLSALWSLFRFWRDS